MTGGAGTGGIGGSGGASAGGGGSGGSGGTGGAGTNPELDAACTPDFTLDLQDTGPKGQIFTNAVGNDAEGFVQGIGREVCRILYRAPDEVRDANHITLIIEDDPEGVAWKAGDVGDITVGISTTHLQNVENDGRDVADEIKGVLLHEMTHMYQNDDKPEATFEYIANMYEGIADAVRIRAGHAPDGSAPNDKGGEWYEKTYTSQAFFWLYADTKHPGFLYELNLSMKADSTPWSVDSIQTISGQSGDALWDEYQAASCCEGGDTSCCQ